MKKLLLLLFPNTVRTLKNDAFSKGMNYYKTHCVHKETGCDCADCRRQYSEMNQYCRQIPVESVDVNGCLHNIAIEHRSPTWFTVQDDSDGVFKVIFPSESHCIDFIGILNAYDFISLTFNPRKAAYKRSVIFNNYLKEYIVGNSCMFENLKYDNAEMIDIEEAIHRIKLPRIIGTFYVN